MVLAGAPVKHFPSGVRQGVGVGTGSYEEQRARPTARPVGLYVLQKMYRITGSVAAGYPPYGELLAHWLPSVHREVEKYFVLHFRRKLVPEQT